MLHAIDMLILTASVSTEGANEKFPFWKVFDLRQITTHISGSVAAEVGCDSRLKSTRQPS
jgi:hypothetical protein